MPIVKPRHILTGIRVQEAMRRSVERLPETADIAAAIRRMIKTKANAVLVDDADGNPFGVVSKTDIMGAYYAGMERETALGDILSGTPVFCFPDDELEAVLDVMHHNKVHRVYVQGAERGAVTGTLAYSDIVGMVYRYCRTCRRGSRSAPAQETPRRLLVSEVMTTAVTSCQESQWIGEAIELLSTQKIGAILVFNEQSAPLGVISKSDLAMAFLRNVPPDSTADSIMSAPVRACPQDTLLAVAVQQMLLHDVQRLFVHGDTPDTITGVLSLSDAARFRSGTCRACTASRLITAL
jgi:CBS domain-containing protein